MSKYHAEILTTSDGNVSLELGQVKLSTLKKLVKANFGSWSFRRKFFGSFLVIGKERFLIAREYGDLFVVSTSAEGADMLRQLRDAINAS